MIGTFNRTQETLADRLPYFGFEPKTQAIWLKDGSATLSLKVTPNDCSLLIDDDLEALRTGLTPVLNHLPEGSVLQALLFRERSTPAHDEAFERWSITHTGYGDTTPARQLLMEARQTAVQKQFESGELFQTRCYLTLRILPETDPRPGKSTGPFSHLSFWHTNKKAARRTRVRILDDLNSAFETLRAGLSALGFESAFVSHEERVRIIYEWLNPERSKALHPPQSPPSTNLSDQLALTDMVETKAGVSLGRTELELASLKLLPEISVPAAMQHLACADLPFTLLMTIYVLPQTPERERLLRKQRLAQGMASGNAVRNLMAEAQLRDIEDTLGALISSGERILGVSFHITGIKESV